MNCRCQRRKAAWYPFLCLTFVTLYIHMNWSRYSVEIVEITPPLLANKKLIWFKLYHGGLRNDARGMNFSECDYSRCEIDFIDNEVQLKDLFSSADAILFQGGRMPKTPPRRAHNDQAYVFVDNESPLHLHSYGYLLPSWNDVINWTMTYRLDSDMKYTYGEIKPGRSEIDANGKNYSDIYRKKTKQVAWLVSDCVTEGKREQYVARLRKYIKVDIYGRCGHLKNCTKEEGIKCFQRIADAYKFYLSFENSVCKDYITEKVFTWFSKDIINVVRGGISYNRTLPAKSYINTDSFNSIEHLGNFMKTLSASEQAYTDILRLKDQFTVIPGKVKKHQAYCDLCKKLHNLDQNKKIYRNIGDWWRKNRCVRYPSDIH